ncbi:hypothetical protein QVD17_26193 [Tagetes erecta]|uniref:Uncharacterized protein n=1 Tax=Tagetes erecta TaxID=13708 RepID=A0AAD8K9P3_TARER|nr:hypothetical protein QVD17_26193 [Tagetes erecta]
MLVFVVDDDDGVEDDNDDELIMVDLDIWVVAEMLGGGGDNRRCWRYEFKREITIRSSYGTLKSYNNVLTAKVGRRRRKGNIRLKNKRNKKVRRTKRARLFVWIELNLKKEKKMCWQISLRKLFFQHKHSDL